MSSLVIFSFVILWVGISNCIRYVMLMHVCVVGTKIFPALDSAAQHEEVWGRRGVIPRILSIVTKFGSVLCLTFRPVQDDQGIPVSVTRNAGWVSHLVWRQWRRAKYLPVAGVQHWFPNYSACSLIIIPTELHRFGKLNHRLRHASCFNSRYSMWSYHAVFARIN